jgi:tetratricopeptide (TPR) repeat protein
MPTLTVLTCPVCGGPLAPGDDRCHYCGSLVVIETDHPRLDPEQLNKAVISDRIAAFRATLRSDSNNETAHYGLGVAYFNLGLFDEAADELTEAARLMPENPHIQAQLGIVLAALAQRGKQGALPAAHERADRALLLQADHTEALLLKADLLMREGKRGQALQVLERLAGSNPSIGKPRLAQAHIEQAEREITAERWTSAVGCWQRAAAVEPDAVRKPISRFLKDHVAILATTPSWQPPSHRRVRLARSRPRTEQTEAEELDTIALTLLAFVAFLGGSLALMGLTNGAEGTPGRLRDIALVITALGMIAGPVAVVVYRQVREVGDSKMMVDGDGSDRAEQRLTLLAGETESVDILLTAASQVAQFLEQQINPGADGGPK